MKVKGPKAAKGGWSNSLFGLSIGIGKIGYLVPLWSYPNPTTRYDNLLSLRKSYPLVPMTIIVNHGNGAGTATDPLFTKYINQYRALGIIVLGYVSTGNEPAGGGFGGYRNLIGPDSIYGINDQNRGTEQAIDAWASYYALDGIYFDNGPGGNPAGAPAIGYPGHTYLQYYQTATAYAKNMYGYKYVFGNPGAPPQPAYIGSVDVIESMELNTLYTPAQVQAATIAIGGTPNQWAEVAKNNPSAPSIVYLQAVRNYISWIYVSDTNDYQTEPSYQNQTLANLAAI